MSNRKLDKILKKEFEIKYIKGKITQWKNRLRRLEKQLKKYKEK